MMAFNASAIRIAYMVVNFDNLLQEYEANWRREIEETLATSPPADVEVVLDVKLPFYTAGRVV